VSINDPSIRSFRPCTSSVALVLWCFVMAFAWNAPACGQTHVDPGEAAILVKCRWTGPADRTVTFQFDEGVRLLSAIQPTDRKLLTSTSNFEIATDGVRVLSPASNSDFLVELRCSVNGPGSLSISVDQAGRERESKRLRFEDLLRQRTELKFADETGLISISRKAGDELRIQPQHENLVFSGSQMFQAVASFNFGTRPERRSRPALHWSIFETGNHQHLYGGKIPFAIPRRNTASILRQAFALNVPELDGAYELRVSLVNDAGQLLGESSIPLVVHSGEVRSRSQVWNRSRRRVGIVIHDPSSVFRNRSVDDVRGMEAIDWKHMLQSVRELGERVQRQSFDSVVLGVHLDGAALYPTDSVYPEVARFDRGRFVEDLPDPVAKDLLELLFREFDQRRITLVPEIDLTAPDPMLESLLGERQIDRDRAVDAETSSKISVDRPCYDPLNPLVQKRILEIHQEIVRRYGHHPSFGGISLSIHDGSWTSLSGGDAETSPEEVRRSGEIAAKTDHEAKVSREPQFSGLNDELEVQIDRCRKLDSLYQRLADLLDETREDAKLYLSTHRLVRSPRFQRELLDLLHAGGPLDELLFRRGIEPRLLRNHERIVLLRPYWNPAGDDEAILNLVGRGINSSPMFNQVAPPWKGIVEIPSSNVPGSGGADQVRNSRLDRFLAHYLVGSNTTDLLVDERTAETGNLPSDLQKWMQSLPDLPFEALKDVPQPIVVKTAVFEGKTWLYATNDSSLPAHLTVKLKPGRPLKITPLMIPLPDSAAGNETVGKAKAQTWTWEFAPYTAKACVVDTPTLMVDLLETSVDSAALSELKSRLNRLESIIATEEFGNRSEKLLLPNSDFESPSDRGDLLPGWNFTQPRDSAPMLDSETRHSGRFGLALEKSHHAEQAAISTFPLSVGGRKHLAVMFWSRGDRKDLTLTLNLTGNVQGTPWNREAIIHASRSWQQAVFRAADLPDRIDDLTFGVSLNEPGKIWLDDFEVLPQQLTPEDEKRLMRFIATIRLAWEEERYADCSRLINGYWGRFLTDLPPVSINREKYLPQMGTHMRDRIIR
jgi:hypothetical protein